MDGSSFSRRHFLRSGGAGVAAAVGAAACRASAGGAAPAVNSPATPPPGLRSAAPAELQNLGGGGGRRPILPRGGVVPSLARKIGGFSAGDRASCAIEDCSPITSTT